MSTWLTLNWNINSLLSCSTHSDEARSQWWSNYSSAGKGSVFSAEWSQSETADERWSGALNSRDSVSTSSLYWSISPEPCDVHILQSNITVSGRVKIDGTGESEGECTSIMRTRGKSDVDIRSGDWNETIITYYSK